MACDNPSKQKQLGRHNISNFDNNKWCGKRYSLLEDILRNKSTQIPDVKHFLLKTGTKQLAESINQGENHLGQILIKMLECKQTVENGKIVLFMSGFTRDYSKLFCL